MVKEILPIDEKYISKIRKVLIPSYYRITDIYDMGDRYLFAITYIKEKESKYGNMDPYYTINKKTLEIKGFAPHQELQKFKAALNNEIYTGRL